VDEAEEPVLQRLEEEKEEAEDRKEEWVALEHADPKPGVDCEGALSVSINARLPLSGQVAIDGAKPSHPPPSCAINSSNECCGEVGSIASGSASSSTTASVTPLAAASSRYPSASNQRSRSPSLEHSKSKVRAEEMMLKHVAGLGG
jgi:hypothetical protein